MILLPEQREKDSVQLELDLFSSEPWQGRSPRALTRAYLGLILQPRGERARVPFSNPLQVEMFPRRRQRKKQMSRTALTLLPLPEEEDR